MNKTAKTLFIIGVSCILLSLLLLARFEIEEVYSKEYCCCMRKWYRNLRTYVQHSDENIAISR